MVQEIKNIYSNISYFHEKLINAYYFKLDWGCTSTWETQESLGWVREGCLSESAKEYRRQQINKYENLEKTVPEKIAKKQREKAEKERQERIAEYWEEHAEEKVKLDQEQAELQKKIADLKAQISVIETNNSAKISKLRKERDEKLPSELETYKQSELVRELEAQRDKCGIFKGKEKKAIQARLDTEEKPKLEELKKKSMAEKKAHQDKLNAEIDAVKSEGDDLRAELEKLEKRNKEITEELTKDR